MKKMLSLAAMFAVLSYASPASAELKIGGDAAVRARGEFNNSEIVGSPKTTNSDDLKYQYRIRLKATADLGSGYFFKALAQTEDDGITGNTVAGGWATVENGNVGAYNLEVSNFYFGRTLENCHYSIGRLPLNSVNNPIFDITLYPIPTGGAALGGVYAVDIPVATWNFDRVFGLNYGTKIGGGELNGTLVIFDNNSKVENTPATGDGLLNDGYALHLSYKTNIGDVTFEPQAILSLTDLQGAIYQKVSPNTFGANATIPAGKSKIGVSGFYTVCKDSKGAMPPTVTSVTTADPITHVVTTTTTTTPNPASVDYNGYLLRLKGESGPVTAWVDYNHTTDKTPATDLKYNNIFVWAQYNIKVHESATGTFSLTPTVRYRASSVGDAGTDTTLRRNNQLRGELYATVTF
ncbi:MAG: porin [Chlorobium sp.]|nr:MAG: porin [Chlorobium sp.]